MLGVDFYFPPFVLNKSAPCIIYKNNKKFIKVSWEADEHLIEINAKEREVHTRTGSFYILNGPGEQVRLDLEQLGMISSGMSPSEFISQH